MEFLGITHRAKEQFCLQRGKGCERCFFTGYFGQEALIELLPIDAQIFERPSENLRKELRNLCQFTFFLAAKAKVLSGKTTVAEIKRVLSSSLL